MSAPALLLLAHGTQDAAGRATWERLTAAVAQAVPEVEVRLAYADVVSPTMAEALAELPGPVVVVPAFLAAGFHVRVDVPEQLAATGRPDVVVAEAFGPDPELVGVLLDRLAEAGAQPGDTVVLAAAGSNDPRARADLDTAAALLTARVGHEVPVGYIAGGEPRVASVVASAGSRGPRVVVATWLLAPGAFHRWLADAGAAVVAEPLGEHPDVVDVVVRRYRAAAA
ncbi:sirohydrochlorin chelatase [Actinomycetospora lemnae]|uniref:CbiX/SirB N-terminal domain-containing protein n=1 Tax=Actinomycetospora lemnae TaxID=3019891 RepID=A0ABT5SQN6_9PSEU|nr:CbiX/SirB N-terminal domain-containing protein [Actinomycetospora sp. DW7H6]MDD7965156.1 CbiX/SirB N-terminal domain-containing protein [Actinomycetospora sp. DW7H6]